MPVAIDFTDKRFGMLVGVKFSHVENGKRKWLFRCDCGGTITLDSNKLFNRKHLHCGCVKQRSRRKNLIGKRYTRLTVVSDAGYVNGKLKWECLCDCGNVKYIDATELSSGETKSCGCYKNDTVGDRSRTHGDSKKSRLYRIWQAMRTRCNNQNFQQYKDYGGRGVSVCDDWNTYDVFKEWALKNGYNGNLSIDRIDYNGGYNPDNCRWSTSKEQNSNSRKNIAVKFNGEVKLVTEWIRELNFCSSAYYHRLKKGLNPTEAIFDMAVRGKTFNKKMPNNMVNI